MASNKDSLVRTATINKSATAVLTAALAHLAGSAVGIGQVSEAKTIFPLAAAAVGHLGTDNAANGADQAGDDTNSGDDDKSDPKQPKEAGNDKVKVDGNQIVDLHVNDEELSNVLEMLSIQSQRNIVASKSVSARVTANLYGVTFFEALDAILNVNGFTYIENGNFIFVYTTKEAEEIMKAQRVKVSKVIHLNYLNAVDAAEFVKPLLSEGAQIKTNGKTPNFPTAGATPVGADDFANSATIVITDFDDHIGEIEALLRQLDTRPSEVLIEATVMQTTLTEDNAFGVDFSIISDMDFKDFVGIGGPTSAINALIGGRDAPSSTNALPADGKGGGVASTVGNTAGPGGLKAGIVKSDVAVFLRVLDEVTDTTILSNPKILALNRMPAHVLVGRKVGYISSTSTDTATTQSVEFLDTGTQLYVRPFVTNEGLIRMELKPQISEAVIRQANDSQGRAVTIPDEDTNELTTNVIVRDGQTIVLGGLFRESTTTTRRQVPLLGDIPLVGYAFRGNEDSTQRNEIIFLVTPSVVNDENMSAAGQRGIEYVDHLRIGAREGVLFWSRDKLTNRRNLRAERAYEAGDMDSALYNVERSLSLNSSQPEAIAMREKLTGENNLFPTRSYLERALHGDTEQILNKKPKAQADTPMFPFPSGPGTTTNFNSTFNPGESSTTYTTPQGMGSPTTPTTPTTPSANPSTPSSNPASAPANSDSGAQDTNGNNENGGMSTPSNFTMPAGTPGTSNSTTRPNSTPGTPGQSNSAAPNNSTAPAPTNPANPNGQGDQSGNTAPNNATPPAPPTQDAQPPASEDEQFDHMNFDDNPNSDDGGFFNNSGQGTPDEANPNNPFGQPNAQPGAQPNAGGNQAQPGQAAPGNSFTNNMTDPRNQASANRTGQPNNTQGQPGTNGNQFNQPANNFAQGQPGNFPQGQPGTNGNQFNQPANNFTQGQPGVNTGSNQPNGNQTAAAATDSARLWCGKHSFMQGMWSFFKFMGNPDSTVTNAGEPTMPATPDNR